jgi:hypothetical protein
MINFGMNQTNFSTPLTRGSNPELAEIDNFCTDHFFGHFELKGGKGFDVCTGAPCQWSLEAGATHTLLLRNCRGIGGDLGERGVRVSKSRIYVIVDEDAGDPVWSTWIGKWEGGTV